MEKSVKRKTKLEEQCEAHFERLCKETNSSISKSVTKRPGLRLNYKVREGVLIEKVKDSSISYPFIMYGKKRMKPKEFCVCCEFAIVAISESKRNNP